MLWLKGCWRWDRGITVTVVEHIELHSSKRTKIGILTSAINSAAHFVENMRRMQRYSLKNLLIKNHKHSVSVTLFIISSFARQRI